MSPRSVLLETVNVAISAKHLVLSPVCEAVAGLSVYLSASHSLTYARTYVPTESVHSNFQ